MKRRRALTALATATVVAPRLVAAQAPATVRIGNLGIATDAPVWLADQRGYFKEQGITVEYVKFTSSEGMMPLLSTGQLDIGSGAPGASLYNAVIRGIDVRAVADGATDPPGYGWAKLLIRAELVKSGAFKTIADLKGMTIGGAARASSSAVQVAKLLAMAGLKYSDVSRTVLPYPEHVVALKSGAMQAALTIEPFATLAVEQGVAVAIMGNDKFYPNQEVSCVLCSSQLIKSKRDVIVRYLRGFLKGVRVYVDALQNGHLAGPGAAEVVDIIAGKTGAPPDLIRRITPVVMDANGRLNVDSMRYDLNFYKEQNFIEGGNISVEQVIDTSLSPEALQTIGTYRRRI